LDAVVEAGQKVAARGTPPGEERRLETRAARGRGAGGRGLEANHDVLAALAREIEQPPQILDLVIGADRSGCVTRALSRALGQRRPTARQEGEQQRRDRTGQNEPRRVDHAEQSSESVGSATGIARNRRSRGVHKGQHPVKRPTVVHPKS
jgi:hypothetical protein